MIPIDDLIVGARVRLIRAVGDTFPSPGSVFGRIEPGALGTIVHVDANAACVFGEPLARVKLDETIPDLADWHNELHVFDEGEVTLADFELV